MSFFAFLRSTDAVAKVFTPVECIWALLWLASASAFVVVEDLVASANLRSANAFTYGNIEVLEHAWADGWDQQAVTSYDIPVETFIARRVGVLELAAAFVDIPELTVFAGLFIAEAATESEAPVFTDLACFWGKDTVSLTSDEVNIPEMALSAFLWFLFATAAEGVEVLVWSAKA